MRSRGLRWPVILWLLLFWVTVSPAGASGAAGLVVAPGDGRVIYRVVPLDSSTLRGLDLLRRSGLDVQTQEYGGLGAAVCAIEGVGCFPPRDDCFCQCRGGGECRYWHYYLRQPDGTWRRSDLGPSSRVVRDGDVDLWAWGGTRLSLPPADDVPTIARRLGLPLPTPPAPAPPLRSPAVTPTRPPGPDPATPTISPPPPTQPLTPSPTVPPSPTFTSTAPPAVPTPSPTLLLAPSPSPSPSPTPTSAPGPPADYLVFVVTVGLLGTAILIAWRQRR
jgi:hypothetical protein